MLIVIFVSVSSPIFAAVDDPTATPTPSLGATLTPTESPVPEATATPTSAVTPPPAQLAIVPMCPANLYCLEDATCAQTDDPVHKGHRLKVTNQGIVTSANTKLFFEECMLNDSGNKYCVPMPLVDAGGGAYTIPDKANWASNKNLFMNALIQRCKAGFTSPTDAAAACTEAAISATDGFVALDAALRSFEYEFQGLFVGSATALTRVTNQPFNVPASGYEWGDQTKYGIALTKNIQVVEYVGFGGQTGQGGATSPHVSQLGMPNPQATCQGAVYDPYGKVFDSNTLKPVANVKVWIFDQKKDVTGQPILDAAGYPTYVKYVTADPIFTNPWTTTPFGSFTFRMPEGTYKLIISNADLNTFEFSTNPATYAAAVKAYTIVDVNSNGQNVIVQNNGSQATLYTDLYPASQSNPAPDIVQTNVAIHKNIPVVGVAPAQAQVYSYQRNVTPMGFVILTGQGTMPFAEVAAFSTTGRKIKSAYTDKDSKFEITIDPNKDLQQGEDFSNLAAYDPVYVRVVASIKNKIIDTISGLRDWLAGKIAKPVFAQKFTPPIVKRPSYVEGFAYDTSGKVLPNTDVMVMDTVSFVVTFRTVADAAGYFVIPPSRLPSGIYQLMYKPQGSSQVTVVPMTRFMSSNAKYHADNTVDLYKPTLSAKAQTYVESNKTLYPEIVYTTTAPKQGSGTDTQYPVTPDKSQQQNNENKAVTPPAMNVMLLVYVVILLIVVVGVGILVVYYLKRKQDPHLYDNQV